MLHLVLGLRGADVAFDPYLREPMTLLPVSTRQGKGRVRKGTNARRGNMKTRPIIVTTSLLVASTPQAETPAVDSGRPSIVGPLSG